MKYHAFVITWVILLINTSAIALNLNVPLANPATSVFQYTAETIATANKQGTVLAGGLNWNCINNRCSISGPWPTPAVASCKALAGMVGALRSYGHNQGAQLDAAQLAQCNAGLPAATDKSIPAPSKVLTLSASTVPLTKAPETGLPVSKTVATPTNGQHSERAVSSKDFMPLALPLPPKPGQATVTAEAKPATAPATQNGFAASTTAPKGGFAAVPTAPAISQPATRQLTNINPALTRQLKFRSDAYTNMKREQERVAAETARMARERYANRKRGLDCDDTRADVSPRAVEICDHVDNNCNGVVDEGQTQRRYLDADGDLHGKLENAIDVCATDTRQTESGAWLSDIGNDCDDTNPAIWHGCP